LEAAPVGFGDRITIGDIDISTYAMAHGSLTALGIRVGNVGYSTDFKSLDKAAIDALRGVDIWIADAAAYHYRENMVHACVEEVIELNQEIGAREVYLTHLPPTMDYQTLIGELPEGYKPAY